MRAPPRPVVRLNRRMLAIVCGLLAALVLGATIWSLQPQRRDRNPATELYNVERVARPENLERLRQRGLSTKRQLAVREFALGMEALERFVRKEPFWRVHQAVAAILALEAEVVDPRL